MKAAHFRFSETIARSVGGHAAPNSALQHRPEFRRCHAEGEFRSPKTTVATKQYPGRRSAQTPPDNEQRIDRSTEAQASPLTRTLGGCGGGNRAVSSWDVKEENLRRVPEFYPLERNSIMVQGMPACKISERITHFLRANSIVANFDDHGASAEALTGSNVKFSLRLWRGKMRDQRSGPRQQGIIMEAQRLRGCAIEFRAVSRALRVAVQNVTEPIPLIWTPDLNGVNDFAELPIKGFAGASVGDCVASSLHSVTNLLESYKMDQNHLGMESLCIFLNPTKVGRQHASLVSRAFLFGEGPVGCRLWDAVVPHMKTYLDGIGNDNSETEDETFGSFDAGHRAIMRNLALQCLANALLVANAEGETLRLAKFQDCSVLWLALVGALEGSVHKPHDAALAATCLRCVGFCSSEMRGGIPLPRLLPALSKAHGFGQARHASLEKEAQLLLASLAL